MSRYFLSKSGFLLADLAAGFFAAGFLAVDLVADLGADLAVDLVAGLGADLAVDLVAGLGAGFFAAGFLAVDLVAGLGADLAVDLLAAALVLPAFFFAGCLPAVFLAAIAGGSVAATAANYSQMGEMGRERLNNV